jgi:hypothetical protein
MIEGGKFSSGENVIGSVVTQPTAAKLMASTMHERKESIPEELKAKVMPWLRCQKTKGF